MTFFSVPTSVLVTCVKPNSGATDLLAFAYGIGASGFSYSLDPATVPDDGYQLSYVATATQPTPTCDCDSGCCTAAGGAPTYQSGDFEITNGNEGGTVTFPYAFSGSPKVIAVVVKPSSGDVNLFATIYNVTATGFSFTLQSAADNDGFSLSWQASTC